MICSSTTVWTYAGSHCHGFDHNSRSPDNESHRSLASTVTSGARENQVPREHRTTHGKTTNERTRGWPCEPIARNPVRNSSSFRVFGSLKHYFRTTIARSKPKIFRRGKKRHFVSFRAKNKTKQIRRWRLDRRLGKMIYSVLFRSVPFRFVPFSTDRIGPGGLTVTSATKCGDSSVNLRNVRCRLSRMMKTRSPGSMPSCKGSTPPFRTTRLPWKIPHQREQEEWEI